ncbi:MAG: hypothetical protein ABEJ86_03385, partial [Halococcoides sp.]
GVSALLVEEGGSALSYAELGDYATDTVPERALVTDGGDREDPSEDDADLSDESVDDAGIGHEPNDDPADEPNLGDSSDEPADDSGAAAHTGQTGTNASQTQTVPQGRNDSDSVLAAFVSFFIIPGLGHFLVDGKKDRGVAVLLFYLAWVFVGWRMIFFGSMIVLFVVGSILSIFTLGFGMLITLLWPIIALIISVGEVVIRSFAAIDAYQHSEYMDRVTGKVDEYR